MNSLRVTLSTRIHLRFRAAQGCRHLPVRLASSLPWTFTLERGQAFEAALSSQPLSSLQNETLWYRMVARRHRSTLCSAASLGPVCPRSGEQVEQSLPDAVNALIAKTTVEILSLRPTISTGFPLQTRALAPFSSASSATLRAAQFLSMRDLWRDPGQIPRQWGIFCVVALAPVAFGSATLSLASPPSRADLEHARRLLADAILFDGHNDLAWAIRTDKKSQGDIAAYDLRKPTAGQTDLARLRQGGVSAQFWSVYVPGELTTGMARTQLEQIDLMRRVIARYPDALQLVGTAKEIRNAKEAGIGSVLGIEGGHAIENSLGALRAYYDLGVRSTIKHAPITQTRSGQIRRPMFHATTGSRRAEIKSPARGRALCCVECAPS